MSDSNTNTNTTAPPQYKYYQNISTPSEMGMSGKGNLKTLGNDLEGLMAYVQLLISGQGNASKTGQPLGNKYFLQTKAQCREETTNQIVPRSIYINNIPMGSIPFIGTGMGMDFTEFRGILPGMVEDLDAFNPEGIFQAFEGGATPPCKELTMETVNNENQIGYSSGYVTLSDISDIDPCLFPDGKNPVTQNQCTSDIYKRNKAPSPFSKEPAAVTTDTTTTTTTEEGFTNYVNNFKQNITLKDIYMTSLTGLFFYLFVLLYFKCAKRRR